MCKKGIIVHVPVERTISNKLVEPAQITLKKEFQSEQKSA